MKEMILNIVSLFLISIGIYGCKSTGASGPGPVSPTVYSFTASNLFSANGVGSSNHFLSLNLPRASGASVFQFTDSGVYVSNNKHEDSATGFYAPSVIAETAAVKYTAGVGIERSRSTPPSATQLDLDLLLFRDDTDNFEIISAVRSSTSSPVNYSRESTIASQTSSVVSVAMSVDGEYFLLVSGASNVHKVLRRDMDDDGVPEDTLNVTLSSVGSTISNGVKALCDNLNASEDVDEDRNEFEFLLVGRTGVRLLEPNGSGLYIDSGAISRSQNSNIVDAALVNWDGDAFADLLLLTEEGLEYFKNISDTDGDIAFNEQSLFLTGIDFETPTKMTLQDLNSDSYSDLLVMRDGNKPLYLQFTGSLRLSDKTSEAFGDELENTFDDAFTGDFNKDGLVDAGFANSDGDIAVFLANAP